MAVRVWSVSAAVGVLVVGVCGGCTRDPVGEQSPPGSAGPASAVRTVAPDEATGILQWDVGASECEPPPDQWCTPVSVVTIDTTGEPSKMGFAVNEEVCGDIVMHIRVDGRELLSQRAEPNEVRGGYIFDVDPGPHTIAAEAEGITGGCNTGRLDSWSGLIQIVPDSVPGSR